MDYGYGQCSNQASSYGGHDATLPQSSTPHSEDDVILASSCPKKRAGRKKVNETRHPVYRGVRQRNGNRWVCEVRAPNDQSRIWLGTYPTAEMAARAHDVAALALKGHNACLNFADSAWRLPVPASTDPSDIQRAAAEAAETFRPQESDTTVESGVRANYNEVSTGENSQIRNTYDCLPERGMYMDEEAVYDMPGLLSNMAEGLLLPPPHNPYGGYNYNWDDTEGNCDVSLWNH